MQYRYDVRTGVQKLKTKSTLVLQGIGLSVIGLAMAGVLPSIANAAPSNTNGFNQNGYNYNARIFSGPADGVDKVLNGNVWGDPTYANDHLVMKWNAAWDACNTNDYNDATVCAGAWTTNEWNGMVPGGSSETEHVKIIWVGAGAAGSSYWVTGGTSIWGNYEVIMDQGMAGGVHTFYTFATPNGLGEAK